MCESDVSNVPANANGGRVSSVIRTVVPFRLQRWPSE